MSDAYAHEVGRKVCLQLCSMVGFDGVSDNALDVLSDVMKSFIKENAVCARSYAENSGRTEINAKDIMVSLDDVGVSTEELLQFEKNTEEVLFGATVPKFPVEPPREPYKSFKQQQIKSPGFVPDYLPVFPAEHTYRETPLYVQKQPDAKSRVRKSHETKKTTEDVLIKFGNKTKREDPYLSSLFEVESVSENQDEAEAVLPTRRQRKMASNWTELILGRLQKTEEGGDPTNQLLPSNSLSSVAMVSDPSGLNITKKRKKELHQSKESGEGVIKEKKNKTTPTPFSATLKFNLNPTSELSVERAEVPKTEEETIPPVVEDRSVETDDYDIFGNAGPLPLEDADSNEVVEDSGAPGGGTSSLVAAPPQEVVSLPEEQEPVEEKTSPEESLP